MDTIDLKLLADQLAILAGKAPGADVSTVHLIWGCEIALYTRTAETREALVLALGLPTEPTDRVGEVNHPQLIHADELDVDGEAIQVSVIGPEAPA